MLWITFIHIHVYRWYKVKHILGPPDTVANLYFRNHFTIKLFNNMKGIIMIWAALWQNQQNDMCAQWSDWASAQSDQSLRCALNGYLSILALFKRTAKTLIRLGRCQGWSESSLGAHAILLVLSRCGSFVYNSEVTLLWESTVLKGAYF